jgi:hypothetical protein
LKKKIEKSIMMNKLRKVLNAAIKDLEQNVDKNWREIDKGETRINYDPMNMRLIRELFFARVI